MWNLEKWYRWTYFHGRNRDAENKHVDTRGAGESGTNWEIGIDMYTLPCVKYIASGNYYKAQEARLCVL